MRIDVSIQPSSESIELSPKDVRKMMRQSVMQQKLNSLPVGKRAAAKKAMEEYMESEEDDMDDDMEENESLVELASKRGNSNTPKVMKSDLPKGVKFGKYKKRK